MRGGLAVAPPAAAPATTAAPLPVPVRGRRNAKPAAPPRPQEEEAPSFWKETLTEWPWQGVKWNLSFVAFLVYTAVIITYELPIGQATMIVAIVALPFTGERLRLPAVMQLMVLYCVFAVASYAGSPFQSVVKDELQNLARVFLITLVAVNVLGDRSRLRFYVFWYLGCMGGWPVRGALFNQFIYHSAELGRIAWNNAFGNPNDLAAFLLFPLGLSIGVLFTEQQKYIRLAAKIGCVLIPLVIFMTQSRGALIALFALTLFALGGPKQRLKLMGGIVVIGIVVAIFAPKGVWGRMGDLVGAAGAGDLKEANDSNSAEQRFEIWKVSTRIIAQNPVVGVGYGAYEYAHAREARWADDQDADAAIAHGRRDAHSTYLEVAAEIGIPGAIMWFAIFVVGFIQAANARRLLKKVWPHRERQIFFVQLAIIAYGFAAIFASVHQITMTYLQVAILWGLCTVSVDEVLKRQRLLRKMHFR
jgi:O-antigen ligase